MTNYHKLPELLRRAEPAADKVAEMLAQAVEGAITDTVDLLAMKPITRRIQ
jgi:hypothetical protein